MATPAGQEFKKDSPSTAEGSGSGKIAEETKFEYGELKYTQRNLFEILLNKPKISVYLLFSDRSRTKRTSVWFEINRKMVYAICF